MSDEAIYAVIDTETNGLMDYKLPAEDPAQPRLAEFGMTLVNAALEIEEEFHAYIKRDGWEMTPETTKINGITDAMLDAEGVPVAEVLARYDAAIRGGRVIVAHNAQFDCKVMRSELHRAGMDKLFEMTPNICTMRSLTNVCKIPPNGGRGGYKWPKLSEAVVFFGGMPKGDHTVMTDIADTVWILQQMRKRGIEFPEAKVHFARPDHPALPKNRPAPGDMPPDEG
jgi:hypothetical protein